MRLTRAVTCGLFVLLAGLAVSPAWAGEILFSIRDGRVTLVARDAQLSDILAVWEREGKTRIVARERVQGSVVSLELKNEPEASALATILRSVTGYIAAKLPVSPREGSTYRCIIINPVPAPAVLVQSATSPAPTGRPGTSSSNPPGMPSMMGNDPGMFPPAFVPPPQDDNEDGGGRMPGGMRQPGMMAPSDSTARPGQPSRAPAFQGGVGMPGATTPAPSAPGSPTLPGQKPPGRPPGIA